MFIPSDHATYRYIERFEGNLSHKAAADRLRRISAVVRFRRILPGHARLYSTGSINLVIQDSVIRTVYRLSTHGER